MRYHDYHLDKYEVSNRGEAITLYLVYGYPGEETDESVITFKEVALYNFTHTTGAIITDIYEQPINEFVDKWGKEIKEWNRMFGVRHFRNSLEDYAESLKSERYKVWCIESATGFYGFVIGKEVENA